MPSKMLLYRFRIDAFTPETLPLSRLAEYMADLAAMLGHKENVHLLGIKKGSVMPLVGIDYPAIPKVTQRIKEVRLGSGPQSALRAFKEINQRLAQDNAVGELLEEKKRGVILHFPGREQADEVLGPFPQATSLDGELIRLGGEGRIVPIHLLSEGELVVCAADRDLAKRIAPYIFDGQLRVHGVGRWQRELDGTWRMIKFRIDSFEVLEDASLPETLKKLKAIKSPLHDIEDPVEALDLLRHGEDKVQ